MTGLRSSGAMLFGGDRVGRARRAVIADAKLQFCPLLFDRLADQLDRFAETIRRVEPIPAEVIDITTA